MMVVIKDAIIEGLERLLDYEYQKIAWFDNDQGLWYSYEENVPDIFDFTGLQDGFDAGDTVFSKEADQALRDLKAACDALGYDWGYDGKTKELLESDEMAIIREMAKRCLKLIEESDGSESTVRFVKPGESQD